MHSFVVPPFLDLSSCAPQVLAVVGFVRHHRRLEAENLFKDTNGTGTFEGSFHNNPTFDDASPPPMQVRCASCPLRALTLSVKKLKKCSKMQFWSKMQCCVLGNTPLTSPVSKTTNVCTFRHVLLPGVQSERQPVLSKSGLDRCQQHNVACENRKPKIETGASSVNRHLHNIKHFTFILSLGGTATLNVER